jgi:hypothetical protein
VFYHTSFAGVTGKLTGIVEDSLTGEPLIGANVILLGTNLGTATNSKGEFLILNITPNIYSVKVSYIGYDSKIYNHIKIITDQTTSLSVKLHPASIKFDEVVVTAKTPLVHRDITSTVSTITGETIQSLPVSNFREILSIQKGVIEVDNQLHIRGGRSNEISYLVDGTYVEDPTLGRSVLDIENDAIQEMSVLSGTFNAEYGNALSGVVNIVTREGSDKLAGKLEYRTSKFGIKKYEELDERRLNGNFSGPLLKNTLRFFISTEFDERGSYLPFGCKDKQSFFSKLTFTEISSIKIQFQNRGSKSRQQDYNHRYKYIPDQYLRKRTDSWQTSFAFVHLIKNNFFYDIKLSYFNQGYYIGLDKDTANYLPTGQRETFSEIGNGWEFYKRSDPLTILDSRSVTADIKADAVWQIGFMNEVKFGCQFKQYWVNLLNIYDPKRDFPYIDDYFKKPLEFATYIQDKIELPYVVINLGLRYDYIDANAQYRKNPLNPNSLVKAETRSQLSPRIGIAYPITVRTKLHFAYGHFFQNPDFRYFYENSQYDLNVRAPLFGQANLDAERTISYEVGVSHQFEDRGVFHITAYYKDVKGLIGTRYYPPFIDGRFVGYTLYVNEDFANIKGFEFSFKYGLGNSFSSAFTYTYMIAKGSASSVHEQYGQNVESTNLYYLDFDRTHAMNATLSYFIPPKKGPKIFSARILERLDASIIFRLASGTPYTPSGRDVGFVETNSLRKPTNYSLDVMIGKTFNILRNFDLRIFAEIYNLTNHRNVFYVYPDTGDPNITYEGDYSIEYMENPANYGPPRVIRLGAGIRF